jgi:hypothetical protein
VGRLVTLAGHQIAWLPAGAVFDGLPPEVADMQPSGFLGRAFPALHPDLTVPPRVEDWSDHHTLIALSRRGEDATGNLILGEESLERWFLNPPVAVSRDDYPALAEAATAGAPSGSSPGGDRPKFAAYCGGRHVLVKFAGYGDSVAQRWRDLLALEHLALEVLRDAAIPAARSALVDASSHRFLEVERFDRIGARGRRAAMTLAAVHQDPAVPWARAARGLFEARAVSREEANRLKLLEAYARLIANVDRHHHNIVLYPVLGDLGEASPAEAQVYRLAPAFDQVPMLHAPTGDGQLPKRNFTPPPPTAETMDVWQTARSLAAAFWQAAAEHAAVSQAMRKLCAQNARAFS